MNADKHSPDSSARSTKRGEGGCLCQWEPSAPTDRSRSDCVHEQVAKRIANVRFTLGMNFSDMENTKEKDKLYQDMGLKILYTCRNEICARFPFFSQSAAVLSPETEADGIHGIGTDGACIKAQPLYLLRVWSEEPNRLKRGYLHMLFHCLYLHPFYGEKKEKSMWKLASDLAVELLIEANISHDLWQISYGKQKERKQILDFFKGKTPSAEVVYQMLLEDKIPFEREKIKELFSFDDHSLWDKNPEKREEKRSRWERLLTYTTLGKERQRHRIGAVAGSREEELEALYKSRYDYRRFLRRFAFSREELLLDEESFDYIFYNLGMEQYGNLPLIEPLEYKEVNRLEELVIAIDTSGSCSKELVQRFLGETYQILSTRENFFKKMKVYIVQCDCCIQWYHVVHSEEEWKNCMQEIKIQGRGGTDFRPVFEFIRKEKEKKELCNLKALIYFTDGDGIYPGEKPDYETAFVFEKKSENMRLVPGWAYKLVIGEA